MRFLLIASLLVALDASLVLSMVWRGARRVLGTNSWELVIIAYSDRNFAERNDITFSYTVK